MKERSTDAPAWLACEGVEKRFGAHVAVRGVNLTLAQGECVALLGPSGCGKSTLLGIISGLLRADAGRLRCGAEVLDDPSARRFVPLRRRGFAMVFQDFSLWPHMTVAENVAFAPRLARVGAAERGERVRHALARVRMEAFADRLPAQLSGGQQQRVAMARAIAAQPRLLLLDEPLSALDAVLREELRDEIASLVRGLGIATVFVTHDQGEALAIADRVAVMREGSIEQCGTAEEVYRRPASEFVARFVGAANVLRDREGRLIAARREDVRFSSGTGTGTGSGAGAGGGASAGAGAAASAAAGASSRAGTWWHGTVSASIFLGERFEISLELPDGATIRGYADQGAEPGTTLAATVDHARVIRLTATPGAPS